MDKTCLSYWYPKIKNLPGIQTPLTEIVSGPEAVLAKCIYGEHLTPKDVDAFDVFMISLRHAAKAVGYPAFLRTGHTSDKHGWRNTCFLERESDLKAHVMELVEFSECCDIRGLPYDVWVVREMLPTIPLFVAFSRMPICREFRFFGRDGSYVCHHPYWPIDAIENASCSDWKRKLGEADYLSVDDLGILGDKTNAVTQALGGYWSVDWLWTRNGWYLTDMAEGEKSFHWEGCPQAGPR